MISIDALAAGAWTTALLVVPAVALTAALLRILPCRPATRHATWAAMLLLLLVLPALPPAPTPTLVRAVAAAGTDLIGGDEVVADAGVDAEARADADAGLPGAHAGRDVTADDELVTSAPRAAALASAADRASSDGASSPATSPTLSSPRPTASDRPRPATRRSPRTPELTVDGRSARSVLTQPSSPAMRRSRDRAGFAASLAGTSTTESRRPRTVAGAGEPTLRPTLQPARSDTTPRRLGSASRGARRFEATMQTPRPAESSGVSETTLDADAPLPRDAATVDPKRAETPLESPQNASEVTVDTTPAPPVAAVPAVEAWINGLRGVRDAITRVPMMPRVIWAGGAAIVALVALLRCVVFRRRLAAASPADGATRGLVLALAQECGVERAPDVRFTEDATSPLLWCGPGERPLLVLPRRLWDELDGLGRRAVIAHELAHLRRRDHVGCWLSLLVGCLYWWHPAVWFIRRRLEEEADFSCDAWVTTLLPEARRAYATALLRARAMSAVPVNVPGPALSLTSNRTRRFARRLTMVMSRTHRPNASFGGALLAVGLAAGSWLASPALACPPDAEAESPRARAPLPPKPVAVTQGRIRVPDAPIAARTAPRGQTRALPGRVATAIAPGTRLGTTRVPVPARTLAPPVAPRDPAAPRALALPSGAVVATVPSQAPGAIRMVPLPSGTAIAPGVPVAASEARLDAMEARLERLEAMLERLLMAAEGGRTDARDNQPEFPFAVEDFALGAFEGAEGEEPAGIVIRTEKGEALWELLARDDVAIRVSRDGDTILLVGPERQRMIAQAFAAMISSDEQTYEPMEIAPEHVDAVWEFMARSDVPVWVRREGDGIAVEGTPLQHMIFQSFADALVDGRDAWHAEADHEDRAAREYAMALRQLEGAWAEAEEVGELERVREIEMMMRRLEQQAARQLHGEHDLHDEHDEHDEHAEHEAHAEHLEHVEMAMHEHHVEMDHVHAELRHLEMEMARLHEAHLMMEAQADQHRVAVDVMRAEGEAMEARRDQLAEVMHEIEEEMEEVAERGGDEARAMRRELRSRLRDLSREERALEREQERLEREAEEHEDRAERMADETHELEDRHGELEDLQAELNQHLEELAERLEELERSLRVSPGMIDGDASIEAECETECETECEIETDCETACASECDADADCI